MYIKVTKTELSKKKVIIELSSIMSLLNDYSSRVRKKNKDSIALEGKDNVLSILNRLWRLLKFLNKWFPKSFYCLCNRPVLILTILLYLGKDYKKFGYSSITAAIYSSFFLNKKNKIKNITQKCNQLFEQLTDFPLKR